MVIEGSFYRLTPISEHSSKFDLELLYTINGKNPRQEFKVAGYGYNLDSAIKAIIRFAISNKFNDEIISLKQYLDEYKKVSEQIRNLIS